MRLRPAAPTSVSAADFEGALSSETVPSSSCLTASLRLHSGGWRPAAAAALLPRPWVEAWGVLLGAVHLSQHSSLVAQSLNEGRYRLLQFGPRVAFPTQFLESQLNEPVCCPAAGSGAGALQTSRLLLACAGHQLPVRCLNVLATSCPCGLNCVTAPYGWHSLWPVLADAGVRRF